MCVCVLIDGQTRIIIVLNDALYKSKIRKRCNIFISFAVLAMLGVLFDHLGSSSIFRGRN